MATDLTPRNEAASAARSTTAPVTAMMTSTMSVENIHAGITLHSCQPSANLKLVADAMALATSVRRSRYGRPHVDGFTANDLFARDAHIVVAEHERSVIGTLHFHRTAQGGLLVRGMVVGVRWSGLKLASAMAALAIVHGHVVYGDIPFVECVVRELPEGINQPSFRSFLRLGFAADTECGRSRVEGTFRDRHLFESAEFDAAGAYFRHRRMMAAGPEVFAVAREFLAAWSQAILPIMPTRRIP